ncbi:hypothetical protein SJAG_02676 [Schizosaccharomyces japonicus yFS275]|uniref:WD-like domain-containing protein n=1 Tax=Schizosaccharomyces japonicus (strain yFS275 / FY16936) TaxID=402676 RepID=B6K0V9_SCHJY|nr:hypothetical protein SJAG_02676 [Schizosaccharomyces japonicus yFS275]EEB07580.1 hypothetical protein SJAG_02676 [Schizosaccharomyces japonicus yFS275]
MRTESLFFVFAAYFASLVSAYIPPAAYTFNIPAANTSLDILGPPYNSLFQDLNYPVNGIYLTNWTALITLINAQDYYGAATVYFQNDRPYDNYEAVYDHSLRDLVASQNDPETFKQYNNLLEAVKALGVYSLPSDAVPFNVTEMETSFVKREDAHCCWHHHAKIDDCELVLNSIPSRSWVVNHSSQRVQALYSCYVTIAVYQADSAVIPDSNEIRSNARRIMDHCDNFAQIGSERDTVSGFMLDSGNHLKTCVSNRIGGC